MLRSLAISIALLLAFAAGAQAHGGNNLHQIRHIAQATWGSKNKCAVSYMQMPIQFQLGYTQRTKKRGFAEAARFFAGSSTVPWQGCRIVVDLRRWDAYYLCKLIAGHEAAHAAGILAHSNNPFNIMYHGSLHRVNWRPCGRFR